MVFSGAFGMGKITLCLGNTCFTLGITLRITLKYEQEYLNKLVKLVLGGSSGMGNGLLSISKILVFGGAFGMGKITLCLGNTCFTLGITLRITLKYEQEYLNKLVKLVLGGSSGMGNGLLSISKILVFGGAFGMGKITLCLGNTCFTIGIHCRLKEYIMRFVHLHTWTD